jgi:hypothetical protein
MVPFNLETFKAGQKALTQDGRVATFVGVCKECPERNKLIVLIKGFETPVHFYLDGKVSLQKQSSYDLVSMVSRHQAPSTNRQLRPERYVAMAW